MGDIVLRAIILAAGRGSRMKGLTNNRPKCLLELNGRTLLDWQIESLRDGGVNEIAIVTGYRRELLFNRVDHEFYNPLWAITNMVSSLAEASMWLKSGPCIVSYSDIFYDSSAVGSLICSDDSLALTYDPNWLRLWSDRFNDPLVDAETFRLGSDNYLTEIGSKPKSLDEIEGQYMGLLRFTPVGWTEIEVVRTLMSQENRNNLSITAALKGVINRRNVSIKALAYLGEWGEIDSEHDLKLHESRIKG